MTYVATPKQNKTQNNKASRSHADNYIPNGLQYFPENKIPKICRAHIYFAVKLERVNHGVNGRAKINI